MRDLLKKLIKAETTSKTGELAAAEIVCKRFGESGIDSQVTKWAGNRANILAHVKSGNQKPGLLFGCHLDVVPPGEEQWENPPFSAIEKNGRIYGRGSADMKGGITATMVAIEQIVRSKVKLKGDIVFLAVAGEETDSCGAKKFLADYKGKLPELAGIVIPEPTNFDIVTTHKGVIWVEISTFGKTAHGAMPHLGINAISSMKKVLDQLENQKIQTKPHKLLDDSSVSINTICGGQAVNVIPDKCSIRIDIRTLPSQNHQKIIADFENMFKKLKSEDGRFEATVSSIRDIEPLETNINCDFVKQFSSIFDRSETKAVGFCTDGPFFATLDVPVVVFGAGKSELCHKPNEYIEISDLEKAVGCYKDIILNFLT